MNSIQCHGLRSATATTDAALLVRLLWQLDDILSAKHSRLCICIWWHNRSILGLSCRSDGTKARHTTWPLGNVALLLEHGLCDEPCQLHNLPFLRRHSQLNDCVHQPDHDWRLEHDRTRESEACRAPTVGFALWFSWTANAGHGFAKPPGIWHGVGEVPYPWIGTSMRQRSFWHCHDGHHIPQGIAPPSSGSVYGSVRHGL